MKHEMRVRGDQGIGPVELAPVLPLSSGPSPVAPGGEVVVMNGGNLVPADLRRVWEGVYCDYLATSELLDAGDVGKREVLARLSAQVAVTWRRMADTVPGGEWWLSAALLTVAEAMENQAHDWSGRRGRSR